MKRAVVVLTLCALVLLVSCAASLAQTPWVQSPTQPANCIDCHLPQQREFDYSRHAVTTRMIREHGPAREHPVTECGPCHSADYLLAPEGQKPQAWDQISTGVTCLLCHLDHTKREKPGDRRLLTCLECHSALARNQVLGAPGVYNPQAEMFQGLAPSFLETKSVPNPAKSHSCAGCHLPQVGKDRHSHSFGHRQPGSQELSCGQTGCHTGKGEQYTDLARNWQREIDREIRVVQGLLSNRKSLSASGVNLKHYQIAKYECDMVAGDLSYGVHNIDFARHLLTDAKRHLSEIK